MISAEKSDKSSVIFIIVYIDFYTLKHFMVILGTARSFKVIEPKIESEKVQ